MDTPPEHSHEALRQLQVVAADTAGAVQMKTWRSTCGQERTFFTIGSKNTTIYLLSAKLIPRAGSAEPAARRGKNY